MVERGEVERGRMGREVRREVCLETLMTGTYSDNEPRRDARRYADIKRPLTTI